MWKPTLYNTINNCLRKIKEKIGKDLYIMRANPWKPTLYNTVKKSFHKTFINKGK